MFTSSETSTYLSGDVVLRDVLCVEDDGREDKVVVPAAKFLFLNKIIERKQSQFQHMICIYFLLFKRNKLAVPETFKLNLVYFENHDNIS